MSRCQLFFTANAGFFLTVNHLTVAVDAFVQEESRGFSSLSSEQFEIICSHPDLAQTRYVIATHNHPDHYCPEWNRDFLSAHPEARFIGAVSATRTSDNFGATDFKATAPNHISPIHLTGERPTYYFPEVTLEFARLPHEGDEFADVANYGCLMTFPKRNTGSDTENRPYRILFLGDAKPADPTLIDWISGRSIDLAMLNFPWITLPASRRFLDEHVQPKKLALIHLPYEETDRNHYLEAARKAAAAYRPEDTVLLTRFGQQVFF